MKESRAGVSGKAKRLKDCKYKYIRTIVCNVTSKKQVSKQNKHMSRQHHTNYNTQKYQNLSHL